MISWAIKDGFLWLFDKRGFLSWVVKRGDVVPCSFVCSEKEYAGDSKVLDFYAHHTGTDRGPELTEDPGLTVDLEGVGKLKRTESKR